MKNIWMQSPVILGTQNWNWKHFKAHLRFTWIVIFSHERSNLCLISLNNIIKKKLIYESFRLKKHSTYTGKTIFHIIPSVWSSSLYTLFADILALYIYLPPKLTHIYTPYMTSITNTQVPYTSINLPKW